MSVRRLVTIEDRKKLEWFLQTIHDCNKSRRYEVYAVGHVSNFDPLNLVLVDKETCVISGRHEQRVQCPYVALKGERACSPMLAYFDKQLSSSSPLFLHGAYTGHMRELASQFEVTLH